jgi:enoyl-CoA hydratase/carnithine racemase
MEYKNLTVRREEQVAIVTLNRPDSSNALSVELMRELENMALGFRDDVETRVIILTGAGRHFCLGADLKDPEHIAAMSMPLLERQRYFHLGPRMIRALRDMDQVTIAAINGVSLGGGTCIASALDFRIGAADCRIGYPESNLSMSLSWVSLPLCLHLVGLPRAKRWVMTSETLPADVLLEWGFLDEVVPPGQLMERARELAGTYASLSPIAVQMVKRSLNSLAGALDEAIMHMDSDQVILAQSTEDFQEAIMAFMQKRAPEFKGR